MISLFKRKAVVAKTTYEQMVVCSNCRGLQTIEIPLGVKNDGWQYKCRHCECKAMIG